MLSRSCRPPGHAVSRERCGRRLAPSSQSAQRRLSPTRQRGGAAVWSRCHRSARVLGTWLACHWWRRDGKPLAGRVSRCCREAAGPPGTPFLANDAGGGWRLPLNPRSDDSARPVNEVAPRCGRVVIAPPASLGPGWRVTGGGVMARHWQDACVDAVAKLPPVWHPVSGNDPGSSFAPWSRSAQSATRPMATQPLKLTRAWQMALPPLRTAAAFGLRHDSSRLVDEVAQGCGRGVVTPPAPLGPGWRVTGGGVMATHWQDACVDAVAKLPPVWHPVSGNDPGLSFAPWSRSAQSARRLIPTRQ